jgi:hypothetical protein
MSGSWLARLWDIKGSWYFGCRVWLALRDLVEGGRTTFGDSGSVVAGALWLIWGYLWGWIAPENVLLVKRMRLGCGEMSVSISSIVMFVCILTSRAAHKFMVLGVHGFEEPLLHILGSVALDLTDLSKPVKFCCGPRILQSRVERPENKLPST